MHYLLIRCCLIPNQIAIKNRNENQINDLLRSPDMTLKPIMSKHNTHIAINSFQNQVGIIYLTYDVKVKILPLYL